MKRRIPKKGKFNLTIGRWLCGREYLQLNVRNDDGGEFWNTPTEGGIAKATIGLDCGEWPNCVSVLLHEVLEFSLNRIRARYLLTNQVAYGHDTYVFMFDHPTFTEATAMVGEYVAMAIPELEQAFKQRQGKK